MSRVQCFETPSLSWDACAGASGVFPRLLVGAYVETCCKGRSGNSTCCCWSLSLPMDARFCGRARDATVLDGAKTAYVDAFASSRTHFTFPAALARTHSRPSVRPSAALGDRCAVAGAVAREDARRRAGAQRTGGKHMLLLLRWRFHVAEARGRSKVAVAGVVVDDTEAPSPGRFGVSGSRRRDHAWDQAWACMQDTAQRRPRQVYVHSRAMGVSVRTRHTGAWRAPHTSRAESKKKKENV
jgi:hypothetical protein